MEVQTNSTIQCFLTMFINLFQNTKASACMKVTSAGSICYLCVMEVNFIPCSSFLGITIGMKAQNVLYFLVLVVIVFFCFALNKLGRKSYLQEFLVISRTWRGRGRWWREEFGLFWGFSLDAKQDPTRIHNPNHNMLQRVQLISSCYHLHREPIELKDKIV